MSKYEETLKRIDKLKELETSYTRERRKLEKSLSDIFSEDVMDLEILKLVEWKLNVSDYGHVELYVYTDDFIPEISKIANYVGSLRDFLRFPDQHFSLLRTSGGIRLSIHDYTTINEVDEVIKVIKSLGLKVNLEECREEAQKTFDREAHKKRQIEYLFKKLK